jgi:hypothetical protein
MHPAHYLRRKDAASYLKSKYGFGSVRTLAKGVVTGDSPIYRKASRLVLYTAEDLDAWALAKIGAPQKSSSEATASRHHQTSEHSKTAV